MHVSNLQHDLVQWTTVQQQLHAPRRCCKVEVAAGTAGKRVYPPARCLQLPARPIPAEIAIASCSYAASVVDVAEVLVEMVMMGHGVSSSSG